MNFEY